jgi:hypothetical protein
MDREGGRGGVFVPGDDHHQPPAGDALHLAGLGLGGSSLQRVAAPRSRDHLPPWTTVLYTVGYIASGGAAAPWGIFGIILGLFLDIALHARSVTMGRDRYRT